MQMRPMNLSPEERTLRMVVGWTLALVGLTLVAAEAGAALTIAGAASAFIGLAVFATGSCGRCPIYRRLGRISRSLRRQHADLPAQRRRGGLAAIVRSRTPQAHE